MQPGDPTPSQGGEYSLSVPGDQIFTTGVGDTGGIQLRNAAGTVIDAVGHTGVIAAYRESTGLAFPTANGNDTFIRKAAPDTDDNANDFTGPQASTPENCGTDCAPPTSGPCIPAGQVTPITSIQTMGAHSACNGDTVTVRGIVTGIDNLYGSSYDAIYKGDSGIWIQEANPAAGATTSSAIFIAGIRRDATNPAGVIGKRHHDHRPRQREVRPGRDRAARRRLHDEPERPGSRPRRPSRRSHSTGNPLPAAVVLDQAAAESQDPITRPYYRALQGMRVTLPVGIATGGGTTKFRDVFVEPGTDADAPVPQERRGRRVHAVVGRARRARHLARRRRRQPGRPAPAVAQPHAGRPRPVRRRPRRHRPVQLLLTATSRSSRS